MSVIDGIRARIQRIADEIGSERELARRAKLPSESHLSLFLSGRTKDIRVGTLVRVAKGARVSLSYLVTGRSDRAEEIGLNLAGHPHATFATAVYAFLELCRYEDEAVEVVRDMIDAQFDPDRVSTVDEWFDAIRGEYNRRRARLRFGGA